MDRFFAAGAFDGDRFLATGVIAAAFFAADEFDEPGFFDGAGFFATGVIAAAFFAAGAFDGAGFFATGVIAAAFFAAADFDGPGFFDGADFDGALFDEDFLAGAVPDARAADRSARSPVGTAAVCASAISAQSILRRAGENWRTSTITVWSSSTTSRALVGTGGPINRNGR